MEQKEFQIDYPDGEEPLLILPLCVGAILLSGKFFRWIAALDSNASETSAVFIRLLYWGGIIIAGSVAAWRLMRTIHAVPEGLVYRFLGRSMRMIRWEELSCASKGRSWYYRNELIYLIPKSVGTLPTDRQGQYQFRTRDYGKLIHFHPTKNNILAIKTYLEIH